MYEDKWADKRTEAAAKAREMRKYGWPNAKIRALYWPEHPKASRRGNVYAIEAEQDLWLCVDDYVR